MSLTLLGPMLAVSCALIWSLSVILFKKSADSLHPVLLNLCKNVCGLVLMVPTILAFEGVAGIHIDTKDIVTLVISGVLGIGIADAMILKALKDIGAGRIAIVECVYSPFVLLMALIFLGETMTGARLLGSALVLVAIICVSWPRGASGEAMGAAPLERKQLLLGTACGAGGIFAMAGGIVMMKPVLAHVPLFWVIGIRLAAGVVASAALLATLTDHRRAWGALGDVERKGLMALACVLSTYVSMMLWVAGFKYNQAAAAAVLNQTSTIFTVVFAALFLRERLTPLKITATLLATGGVLVMALA
jgi:drug/metabolite transporter (DMT)-like permease